MFYVYYRNVRLATPVCQIPALLSALCVRDVAVTVTLRLVIPPPANVS